jgi:hypothetical protein
MRTNRERSKVTSRIRLAGSSAPRLLRFRRSHLSPLVLLCNIIRAAASNVNDEFAARSGLEPSALILLKRIQHGLPASCNPGESDRIAVRMTMVFRVVNNRSSAIFSRIGRRIILESLPP